MSVAECEATLGMRGRLVATAENRPLLRKWLAAQGVPALFAHGMAMRHLAAVYNDISDKTLDRARSDGAKALADIGGNGSMDGATEQDSPIPVRVVDVPVVRPVNGDQDGAAAAIEAAIRTIAESVTPRAAPLDADAVRGIVRDELADREKIVRVEMVRGDGEVVRIDGAQHREMPKLAKLATVRDADGYVPNIWLAGEASSGKTSACKRLAKAMGLTWYFNGAISMPHEMLGFIDGAGNYHRTPFRDAYEHGGFYTFDEVDRCDPGALLAVNPHLANGLAQFPDRQVVRHRDCIISATGNTWGLGGNATYVGACKLDAAFVDRFPYRLEWNIDESLELAISGNESWCRRVQRARANAKRNGLKVIIGMRTTLAGAASIRDLGMTEEQAAETTYLANLTPEQRRMVESVS